MRDAPASLLERAARADQVVGVVAAGESMAALRLGTYSPRFAVVAADAASLEWLVRMCEAVAATARAKASATALAEENDQFAAQLASDLEELTFLRSMVERLTYSSTEGNLTAIARQTLPVLNATVRAGCLAFLRLPNPEDPYTATPVAVEGPEPLPHEVLSSAVRRFGPGATAQPLVKNWDAAPAPRPFGEAPLDDYDRLPGVRSLVLAPLASGTRRMGWLVAVNRVSRAGQAVEASWQLASDEFGSGEATLMATTASILATHASNVELLREKEQIMVSVVRSLVSAIESKDKYTRGHSERVALYTRRLARELGYSDDAADDIYLAALLHDVGKIGVRDAVLNKDGKLTDEEYAEISRHPDEGWAILCDLEQLRYVLPGVLHHHERWDGRGYPDGLAGTAIPIDGRVMAVADAYDAMTSDRPYRKGMPSERAETILREGAGTQWDPRCIEAFFSCLDDVKRIKRGYHQRERRAREAADSRDRSELVHEVAGLSDSFR